MEPMNYTAEKNNTILIGTTSFSSISERPLEVLSENSKYKIAILDSVDLILDNQIGYTSTYYKRNKNLTLPLDKSIDKKSTEYKDTFPPMFIIPRLMVDYGTIKPGFYFYSSEILEKVSLTGGASSNNSKDLDL